MPQSGQISGEAEGCSQQKKKRISSKRKIRQSQKPLRTIDEDMENNENDEVFETLSADAQVEQKEVSCQKCLETF